ncbi:MAG: topoisomerase DNA-binding C4 zinc finger domain-containing protein, partial [Bacilli bacterium]|nr:topoisomerase DNA-binding C4 zinc finger domain-containing protein [Bacilli bacterium]
IKKMEELGIGRPSTYAITTDTLKKRYYVKVEKKALIPTEQGILTSEKLDEYFSSIISVKYTARMEEILDEISEGKKVWHEEIRRFYNSFMPLVEYANENMEKIYPVYLDEVCPNCGSKLVKRNGRFGPFVACSAFPNCKYIKKEEKKEVVTDILCPKCGIGHLVERVALRGRSRGKKFYACNRYPECKTTFSELPVVEE